MKWQNYDANYNNLMYYYEQNTIHVGKNVQFFELTVD